MSVTVFANNRSIQSGYTGQAVTSFPDVCKTPVPIAGAVPIPYPNISMSTVTKTATKTTTKQVATKTAAYKTASGDEAGALKGHLSVLHNQLMTARPGDATQWHKLLDEYVLTAAKAYETLSSNKGSIGY